MRKVFSGLGLVLVTAAALCACTGGGVENAALLNQPLPKGTARIKIVRTEGLVAALRDARIKLDGKQVAALANGGSTVIDVAAGSHEITSDAWDSPGVSKVKLDAKPGTLYTLEVTANLGGTGVGAFGAAGALVESAGNPNGGLFLIRAVSEKRI